jgi:hypothetical protein
MGLDVWFKDDIANILQAANEANLSAILASGRASAEESSGAADVELLRAYRRGFVAAVAALAQALGLPVRDVQSEFAISGPDAGLGRGQGVALRAMDFGGRRCAK